MAGVITIKFNVIKNGMKDMGLKSPIYIPGPVEPQFGPGRYIYFEGFSVDEKGKQHYMDATVAYRQTCLRVIEYLRRYGEFLDRDMKGATGVDVWLTFFGRLLGLPDLSAVVVRSCARTYCWNRGYSERMHDAWSAN